MQCTQCNGTYRAGYRRQHILSSEHKRATGARGINSLSSNGVILRSRSNGAVYDVYFRASSAARDFSTRHPTSSGDEENVKERLQDDFLVIEEFFAHFQVGIIARIEEGTTRLVKKEYVGTLS